MFKLNEKKESIWNRLENDCDIDELIYDAHPTHEVEEKVSDR